MSTTESSRKVRTTLNLDAATLAAWCESYASTNRLPSTNIPCAKCHQGITATHGNLHSKVKAYGGIQPLLITFVCKSCKAASAAPKVPKAHKEKAPKVQVNNEKRYDIPQLGYNPTSYSIQEIAASASLTQEFTNGVCLHPQRFLNDEGCDNCPLYANCAAGCKTLSRRKQRELAKASK